MEARDRSGPRPEKLTVAVTDAMGPVMMAEPDQHQKRTLGEFLWEVFDLQLRKTQRPLPWKMRFAIALSGSLALFSVLFSGRLLVGPQPQYGLAVPLFQDIGSGVWVNVAVWVIVSAFFATLVAALPTRSGPVRLFLAGLFLPALTVNVVRLTSGSWPGP